MSYKERSIWASLIVLVYIWFNYFAELFALNSMNKLSVEGVNDLLLDVVIITIVLEIAVQIIVAIIDNKDANYDEDERDKIIALHGNNYAYNILFVGVFLAVFYTVIPTLADYLFPSIALPNNYMVMHLIIIFALAAEIVSSVTKIVRYRRGF